MLVVDNDGHECERLIRTLGELGSFQASVTRATGPERGLTALLEGHYDACFIDGDRDESGAREFARQARAAGIEMPIILLARAADFTAEMQALGYGVTQYLEKDDVRVSVLDRILRNTLLRGRLSQQHRIDQVALAQSEQRLRSVVQWAGILVYEWDMCTDSLEWDGDVDGYLGYESGQLPKTFEDWADLVHPDDRRRLAAAIESHLKNETPEFNEEYRIRHGDGSYRIWVDRGKIARAKDGQRIRWIGMASDVTEARQLAERVRVTQRLEALGRLAGGVAHDFNNIITVMAGYIETVLKHIPPGNPVTADLHEIQNAAARASTLTRQLLAFGRKQRLEPVVLDLNDVVHGVDGMLRRTIGENVELRIEPAADLGAIRADPGQLEQVLVNLAVNARDAMPTGGVLVVRTSNFDADDEFVKHHDRMVAGRYVRLQVTDSGTGIPADVVKHIFEPFFTTKERGQGTGLGLATVYGVVKQSGGHVWVDTTLGEGTTFSIYLPVVDSAAVAVPRQAERLGARGPASSLSKTILVVEDEESIRQMVADVLARAGFQVLAAKSGAEGINAAAHHRGPIDLLVTDVVLPGTNGLETARAIMTARPQMAVLYTSGYSDEFLSGSMTNRTKLLRKPFTPSALVRTVEEILSEGESASVLNESDTQAAL